LERDYKIYYDFATCKEEIMKRLPKYTVRFSEN